MTNLFAKLRRLGRRRGVRLRVADVAQIIEKHGAQPWFLYAFNARRSRARWDIWRSCYWIEDHVPRDAHILETGCGCGTNLIWLGQRGFTRLNGSDVEPKAIAAARDLSRLAGVAADFWVDDGIAPATRPEEPLDVVLSLNWTFLADPFAFDRYAAFYAQWLRPGGYLVIDVIDAAFNDHPMNAYLSSDWGKPEADRAPSEYKKRYSQGQIEQMAEEAGLRVVDRISQPQAIPKHVYVLQRAA